MLTEDGIYILTPRASRHPEGTDLQMTGFRFTNRESQSAYLTVFIDNDNVLSFIFREINIQ